MAPIPLRIAVCLFDDVTYLDAHGALELWGYLRPRAIELRPDVWGVSPYSLETVFLSKSLDPVVPFAGPSLVPTQTYEGSMDDQFDILLIPGGIGARPNRVDSTLSAFVIRQAPKAKHIITVCTGSWILAKTGLLDGLSATTNKAAFNMVKEDTKDFPVTWVAKARWVVSDDKKIWTASGVTAGMDLAADFLEYLVGPELTKKVCGIVELSHKGQDDDEFAAFHGLV